MSFIFRNIFNFNPFIHIINKIILYISYLYSCILSYKYKKIGYYDIINTPDESRLPKNVLKGLSRGIKVNSRYLAGKVLFFKCERSNVSFFVTYKKKNFYKNMSKYIGCGLDIYEYVDGVYNWNCCIAPNGKYLMHCKYDLIKKSNDGVFAIFFPSFGIINHIFVSEELEMFNLKNLNQKTVICYGSSITQGCSASRPGLIYTNQLFMKTGYFTRNYGFSESAKGDPEVIKYISSQKADVYVLEYDHNASVQELEKTHSYVYYEIRKNNPEALIIFLTRLSGGISISLDEENYRFKIVRSTYVNAKLSGDNKVAMIRGKDLVGNNPQIYLSDDRHPNDFGMSLIANSIYDEILKAGI